jgi:hypothetical protein
MKVAPMYATADVQRVANQYAEGQPARFLTMWLTGGVSRPYGGGDGKWEFYGCARVWHSPADRARITVIVTIEDGGVTNVTHHWR